GVDILWLSPVYSSPMDDNGYDISDYYSIAPEFGTLGDMDELIGEAGRVGIKIMMDVVVNHTSDEHPWFIESSKDRENPKRDWYIWKNPGADGGVPNNWISFFSGTTWEFDERTEQYYLHLFSKRQPDLNWENSALREEIYKMINWWLDKGVMGLRLDVINGLSKPHDYRNGDPDLPLPGAELYMNGPRIHSYLKEMNEKVFSLHDVVTVGETNFVAPSLAIKYTSQDRNELDMVFQFEHMSVDAGPEGKWDPVPLDFIRLKNILSKWQNKLYGKGWNSLYWNNHDQPRAISRFGNDKKYRVESAKMLATVIHLMQGTPFIYQGEEIGMTNCSFDSPEEYRDIETVNYYKKAVQEKGFSEKTVLEKIGKVSRDNARTPMQWDSSTNGGFSSGIPWIKINPSYESVNVEKAIEDKDSIFYYYRKLIKLRKSNKYGDLIVYGKYKLLMENHRSLFVYTRWDEGQKLLVICNFGEQREEFFPEGEIEMTHTNVLLSNYSRGEIAADKIVLRPYESLVLECLHH
ncbi:MAG: alpha-glucosidase, partial [Spirochaetales bacterium]|nr:alpha-glucosidase [Spirochaetales bacterium]